ncbi:MAG: TolC family protein [Acidobacteriota bacterium]
MASGQSSLISRQQAVDEALARNPSLAAAGARVEQARANVVVAGAFADASAFVDVPGQRRILDPRSGSGGDQGVGVTLPFPGTRGLRRDVAMADLRAAEFDLYLLRQQTASQAVQAYDAILVTLRHREDLQQNKQLATDFVQKTQARYVGGTVARVDVIKAETDLAQAENDLIANDRSLANARASLNRILGRQGGAPVQPSDSLEVPQPLASLETMATLAQTSRPDIANVQAQLESARKATKLSRRFWLPDIGLSVTRNDDGESAPTFTSAVAFGLPIFFWQHQRGEVAGAVHREEELTANIADIRAQVSLDVESAYANASTAIRQAEFIRDHLLPQAREVYRVASVSYGLGGSSALDLLDAKRTLLDAESQYVDALGAANEALSSLELAVGAPLPPSEPTEKKQ